MRISAVAVPSVQHQLPKHPDQILPKFDLDNKEPTENHVEKIILAVQNMNVQHEDVVFCLFPLNLKVRNHHGTSS